MKNLKVHITNKAISMATLLRKYLLTSLCQREAISPSLAKRGEGRFYDICILTYDLVSNLKFYLPANNSAFLQQNARFRGIRKYSCDLNSVLERF